MSIIGKSLAHYEVTAQIGKGGMGEVYQAKDTKLGRDVAIKVLPEEFAMDADRVARFQREAKLLASLNHPNIAAIHGLEEAEGTHFLVLELIEGQTLAERIKGDPVPVEEALKLGLQIAEALEAAHEKGVIHRDLKPANIKVTPDGKVKVLDFGLAKAFAGDSENMNLSNSPTLSDMATQQGVILGTAAYMSPEQARGNPVDKRADIWAFGVVLFEMLTGRQVFLENTVSDTLASVLKTEPEWKRLPQNLHPRIRLLLERCLKKEPKDRYSGISDARVDIQEVLADPNGIISQPISTVEPRRNLRTTIASIAAAVILTAIIVGAIIWNLRLTPLNETRDSLRFTYEVPKDQELNRLSPLAISPDGRKLAYGTLNGIYLHSFDEFETKLIPGTEEAVEHPFFSYDGKWIGYFARDGKLKTISINGGSPKVVCMTETMLGASWEDDDTIIYGTSDGKIMRVSSDGGTPTNLIKAESTMIGLPQILPGGKSVLFTNFESSPASVMLQSLDSGESKELFLGYNARYLPTGHIIYSIGNNLYAVKFDLERLEVTGEHIQLDETVSRSEMISNYAISDSGTLIYIPVVSGADSSERKLVWVNREGREEEISAPPQYYLFPKISPDGTKIALTIQNKENRDIWIWDIAREKFSRLTYHESWDYNSIWTLDSKRVVFTSARDGGSSGIYWKVEDGAGEPEKVFSIPGRILFPFSWSKDGKILAMIKTDFANLWDIEILSMEDDRTSKSLIAENSFEIYAMISPNGQYVAYVSIEGNQANIYVCTFPDVKEGKWQISTDGGNFPLWSPEGKELFYIQGNEYKAVTVETEPRFEVVKSETLFHGDYVQGLGEGIPYDIHPYKNQFLMMKEATISDEVSPKINIILNWFEELKDRVPVN